MRKLLKNVIINILLLMFLIEMSKVATSEVMTIEIEDNINSNFWAIPTIEPTKLLTEDLFLETEVTKEQEAIVAKLEEEMLIKTEETIKQIIQEQARVNAEETRLAEQQEKQHQIELQQEKQQTQSVNSNITIYEATYYTPHCNGCSGVTASGYNVLNTIYYEDMRIVASDNSVLPMWSIIQITTPYETFKAIVLDRGGAIKGSKLDILVADGNTARKLGRHKIQVQIIRWGKGG